MSSPLGFKSRQEPLGEIRQTQSAESGSAPADGATQCAGIREARGTHVPSGYKRTEVGVVPEDWGVQSLKSMLGEPSSYGINAPAVPFDASLPTYIRITDIGEDGRFRPTPRVSVNGARDTLCFLRPGDLVFARTGASVGKSYLYDPRDGPLVFAGFLIRIAPDPNQLRSEYIAQYVQTRRYWNWIANNSARSGQPGINAWEYGSLPVPLPPVAEQRAIAAVLMDVDALIGSLEALIGKKRAIKQAAMQQLLTGRTRLPGFEGKWETRRLGDHLRFLRHGSFPRSYLDPNGQGGGGVKYLHYGDIHTSERVRLDPTAMALPTLAKDRASRLDRLGDGDLVFVDASEDIGGVGKSFEIMGSEGHELVSGLHTIAVRFNKAVLADGFKAYLQFCPRFRDHLRRLAAGTKVYATNRAHIASAELRVPPLREQRAIATVLTDMDDEIAALERRLDKTRAIKQGMMQQLLTGAVRLPVPEDELEGESHDA